MAANISEMGLLQKIVQVTSLLPALVQGGRWVFLGGFTGLEEGGHRVRDNRDPLDDDADSADAADAADADDDDNNDIVNIS